MTLYEFAAFQKASNLSNAQVAELFGMPLRTVQDLRLKASRFAKDYVLKNVDESKFVKFLEWKLEQVQKQIAEIEKQLRLDAIRQVREIVAEFGIGFDSVVAKKRGRPFKNKTTALHPH